MTNSFERETVEFIPVVVTVDGDVVTSGVEFAQLPYPSRPTAGDWAAPVAVGDEIGVMTSEQDPGDWVIWGRVTSSPEIPVFRCGLYTVT